MDRIALVVCAANSKVGAELVNQLSASGFADVLELVTDLQALSPVVQERSPDLVFAHLGEQPADVLETLSKLPAPHPLFVVAGPQDDSALILSAMRLGAREFLSPTPESGILHTLLERLLDEISEGGAQTPAPVVAVLGAKGGVGATFVACQLGAALQALGGQTAIVDLNLPLGDVALHLDLHPAFTLANTAAEGARIDATSLRSILQPHASGLQVLATPSSIEHAHQIRPTHVERVLQVLRHEVRWVVIDVSRTWKDECVIALDRADQILVVATNDLVVLNHTRAYLQLLSKLGFEEKVRLILNCESGQQRISANDCKEFLSREFDFRLPADADAAVAIAGGELLSAVSRRGPLNKAISSLAKEVHAWCGVEVVGTASGFRGRIQKLFGRARDGVD